MKINKSSSEKGLEAVDNKSVLGGQMITIEIAYQKGMDLSQHMVKMITGQVLRLAKYAENIGEESIAESLDGVTYISHGDLHNFSAMIDSSFDDAFEESYVDPYLEDVEEIDPYDFEEPAVLTVYANIDFKEAVVPAQGIAA